MTVSGKCESHVSELYEPSMHLLKVAKKKKGVRKYDEDYLKLKFSWTGDELQQIAVFSSFVTRLSQMTV
jgi:hypothetical protein